MPTAQRLVASSLRLRVTTRTKGDCHLLSSLYLLLT